MKVRKGFVSNSSSSSFCLMGIYFGEDGPGAYALAKNTNLVVEHGIEEYDDSVYVGLPPDDMKDDETLLQFKNRILEQLNLKDPDKYKIDDLNWIVEGGYNG